MVARFELWRRSMFFEHFAANELFGIGLLATVAIAVLVLMRGPDEDDVSAPPWWAGSSWRARVALAVGVAVVVRAGAAWAFRDYALLDDEYSGLFQATIYAAGRTSAGVGEPWCSWIAPMTPTSIWADGCQWRLAYFPVNALLRGAFMAVHLNDWAHPVVAALSVLLLMDLCRRAWPDRPERAVLAGLMLAASTQFLLMSMSAFSMPAHLLASVSWLWLYVRRERWAAITLPWVGVVAMGVHSPYPHLLFAGPLILRYLAGRRFRLFAYVTTVYLAGCVAWETWLHHRTSVIAGGSGGSVQRITSTAANTVLTPAGDPLSAALSTVVLGTWNVPVALLCVLAALLAWKRLDTLTRWIAASLAFTFFARAVFFSSYGAGWGHRYMHAVLPNLVIVAAAGVAVLADAVGPRRAYRLVAASLVAAVFLQLPVRALQARRIVTPYERASRYLETLPADVAIVQFESLQWGRQLLRNDPFLRNSPKLMSLSGLSPASRDSLERRFPGRVRYVRPEEITALGVKPATRIGRFEIR